MLDWQAMEKRITRHIVGKPPLAMYDIGVGNFPKNEAATLKGEYPDMLVYGAEPHPQTYSRRLKTFPGPLWPVAIASTAGKASLYLPKEDDMASLFPRSSKCVEVDAMTLDEFDRRAGQPDRILLWMDIEGGELDAIQSGPELFGSGRVLWVNVEHRKTPLSEGESSGEQVDDALTGLGYKRVDRYNNHGTHEDFIYKLKVKR